jgi:hypothetical protein
MNVQPRESNGLARILVLGGYGVFGGRLARRLVAAGGIDVIVAGRSLPKAQAFCTLHGGTPAALDRDGDLAEALLRLRPCIVVDAAGPFQAYAGDVYRVARAATAAGAHYIDLADDAEFVSGITAVDADAKSAGVTVISGASTVPAISAAVLDALTEGLQSVSVVGSTILPGNRAPRGLSVVQAIVGQAGRPLRMWRGGRWVERPAWGDLERTDLAIDGRPLGRRYASRIGAPDLILFGDRYKARSVTFAAGLELKLMHFGLWALALPARFGLVTSLGKLARPLKWAADRLERFGSDRGGMMVRAIGRNAEGKAIERRWTLIAEACDGPEIPATPAFLLCRKLIETGQSVPRGATPAVGLLSLAEIEEGLAPLAIRFARTDCPAPPLMHRVLGADAMAMPEAWRRLTDIQDCDHFAGEASVERGTSLLSRLVGRLFGFPEISDRVRVEVTKEKMRHGERWTRRFDGKVFVSHLSRRSRDDHGILRERFGPFSFVMRLRARSGMVEWPVERWAFAGMPMPNGLMPRSQTTEYVDEQGRFRFDVGISVPVAGFLVRYRGWLAPI